MSPQQHNVFMALNRTYPRTFDGIAGDLDIPAASVRRTVNELRRQGVVIRSRNEHGYVEMTANPTVSLS